MSDRDFTIRAASAADVPAMHRLRLEVRENRLGAQEGVTEESYLPFLGCTWVAEAGNQIIGFAALDLAERQVWALFVDPASEGRGVGSALHEALVAGAIAHGCKALRLSTEAGTRAAAFYARKGWSRTASTRGGEVAFERQLG